jgi:hypothetical protein
MSALVIPAPTVEEQAAEDFDPIPRIAPASREGTALQPYKLGLPNGEGGYVASFDDWAGGGEYPEGPGVLVSTCLVRYTDLIPATCLPFRCPLLLYRSDLLTIVVTPSRVWRLQ